MTVLAMGAGSALAVRGHVLSKEFGSPGAGPGQLKEPDGVAVNEATGVVYVAEKGNNRVQMFDPSTGKATGEFNGSGSEGEGKPAGGGAEPDEEATGEFKEPTQIAVDNSCEQHKPKLSETTTPKCSEYDKSYGDVYVVDSGHKVVDKYTAAGVYVGQITAKTLGVTELFGLLGVAVEADGDLLVSAETGSASEEGVYRLSSAVHNLVLPLPAGFFATRQEGFLEPGLAVAGGRVFIDQSFNGRVIVWGAEGSFQEKLYEGPLGGVGGEACTGDVYVDTGTAIDRYEGAGGLVESPAAPEGAGPLELGSGYGVAADCSSQTLFAGNANAGRIDVYGPTPPGLPEVQGGSGFASEVTSDGAKLSAVVNPRSEPGEPATTYRFEYGPCPAEGSCEGEAYPGSSESSVPASYEPAGVSLTLRGLAADTRYHYRLSARNKFDLESSGKPPVYGEELTLTTQPAFPGGLLDGRGWELVTPPDKYGAEIEPMKETGVIQAAADGGAISYLASAPTEADPVGGSNKTQVLSRREATGWSSCDIGLPNVLATGPSVGEGQQYRAFAPDLQAGLAWPMGTVVPGLAPGAREVSPLLVGLSGACEPQPPGRPMQPSYQALLSGCPESGECERAVEEHADLEPGIEVADESDCRVAVFCAAKPVGSNPSLSAVVLESEHTALVHGAPDEALYEWDGGHVDPVSVSPSGNIVGGDAHAPKLGSYGKTKGNSLRGAVSEDGSRVVWSENTGGGHLYVWDRASGKSAQVNAVQEGASGEGGVEPVFQFATADGSKVFFTDPQRLTESAGKLNGSSGTPDLYECEVTIEGEGEDAKPKCVLGDLTPNAGGANVLGLAIGYSGDASTIYFVAGGVLSTNEDPSGQTAVAGAPNLYVWHGGTIALVAVLSGGDAGDWGGSGAELTDLTARVSADGEWLAFMSNRPLTGYDNRDVHSGARDEEVYLYHDPAGGSASLVCVSCNPTGERPSGVEYGSAGEPGHLDEGLAGGSKVWPNETWIAANVPPWAPIELKAAQYQSRYLDENGRMFFDSSDGLVPRDTNGTEDVYEYEPAGVGTCETGGPGYVVAEEGCIGLVSSGESSQESGFLDASQSGDDVFFLTSARLSGRDTDTAVDIYDARVGGSEPPESEPVECLGDACQSPVSPPRSLTPGSLTATLPSEPLAGAAPGTGAKPSTGTKTKPETRAQKLARALKACAKKPKRRRAACVRQARRRYGAKPVKKNAKGKK